MKLHPRFLVAAGLLALAACQPGAAEYTDAEAPKTLALDNASAQYNVRFAPGSSHIIAADAARLRAIAASGRLASSDRVTVAAAGPPALAAARVRAIAAELLRYRIAASPRMLASVPPNQAVIESGRYLVTLPTCPNWSKPSGTDLTNTLSSNFGCANAVNLGLNVASPADLVEGRPLGLADGQVAAAAVNCYLNDKVQLPAATTVGPIAASSSTGPVGASAGTTGSTP